MKNTKNQTPQKVMASKSTAPASEKSVAKTDAPVVQFVKKISNKLFPDMRVGEKVTIKGSVTSSVTEAGDKYGDYQKFGGEFYLRVKLEELPEEKNAAGKTIKLGRPACDTIFSANIAFLPAIAEAMVDNAFKQNKQEPVDIHFELEKTFDADPTNARGFQWTLNPIGKGVQSENRHLLALTTAE
jgi:hypothetical protein